MADKYIIKGLDPFIGKHCETTALKRVLGYHGLDVSEEMLMGIGGGIGLFYWHTRKMPTPFVGARNKKIPEFIIVAGQRVGAEVTISQTTSPRKGYQQLKALLAVGEPAIVYGDLAYLPYLCLPETAHFGGHVFVVTGIDEDEDTVYIYDRGLEQVTVTTGELAASRSSKYAPFAPKHRLVKLEYPAGTTNLADSIRTGIRECCQGMLRPPMKNMGLAGMIKWSQEVLKWPSLFQGRNLLSVLISGFIYIETGGTGGSAFRLMYADFLNEARAIIREQGLTAAAEAMRKAAAAWSDIARGYLPDSCPSLGKLRELILEKNSVFERQPEDYVKEIAGIDQEMEKLTESALAELKYAPDFLADVSRNIIRCSEIEREAYQILSNI